VDSLVSELPSSNGEPPPSWRLPEGVNAALWRYAHTRRLAEDEDAYFRGHPLFEADARALDERFTAPGRLVDLGCGAGRLALRFARRGFDVTAVDLSRPMLRVVASKAAAEGVAIRPVAANLCRLGCFLDGSFDYALSMFSTLGMIRGAPARSRALAEACRILRPGGRLALHAHNRWLNLRDPQGRLWLLGQGVGALLRRPGLGDRRMTYRGIPGMEVHLYSWPELRRDLRRAGLRIVEVIPIDAVRARPIRFPRLAHGLRAGGWIVFASRPG
jgi:SAM-dependent methyltransferase